jgi:hypothetical protein
MSATSKPRYPANVFHRLRRYPVLHCQNPECGRQLTPRYTLYQGKEHRLESVAVFKTRKFCDMTCTGQMRALRLAQERSERAQQGIAQPAPPRSVNAETKTCSECPKVFVPKARNQLTCCFSCAIARNKRLTRERTARKGQPTNERLESPVLTDPTYGGPPAPEEVAEELEPEPDMAALPPKDPRLNRPVRPVKMPSTQPIERPPVPPPSLQARLPDPRPVATPFTVSEGEAIERGDFGTCPNEGCGKRLNAFGRCGACEQRKHWLKGQRAKVGAV